jgi:non-heme chloroperoxidase
MIRPGAIYLVMFALCNLCMPVNAKTSRAEDFANDSAVRDRFFTTSDGAHIHYLLAGQPTTELPVVFIPGFTLTASLWKQQLVHFSQDRMTIAIDSRSQCGSSITVSGNTPERRAIDLRELTSYLNVKKFVVVGWSQGSQDVAAYIQQFGTDSIGGIAFVDSPVTSGPENVKLYSSFSESLLSVLSSFETNPQHYETRVRSIFRKPHPELDIDSIVAEAKRTPPSIEVAMLVMDLFGVDRRPALAKINCPTLVIASSASALLQQQKEMAAAIVDAKFVVVEDAGHAIFVDDPVRFQAELDSLLRTVKH